MSASMSKTFMSPDFLTKFLEEYRELLVLWQVRSADHSNRAKRDEAWDSLVQFTREKIPDADLCFVQIRVDSIRASFRKELRRVRDSISSPLLQLASMNSFWILKCTNNVRSPLMRVW
jgi:hypothetical protein